MATTRRRSPSDRNALSTSLLIVVSVLLHCGCAPWLASAAWGPSGNVVPNIDNTGPPLSCLPPYSRLNLEHEYDVFDKLLFNQIISLAVATGASPYISQLHAWALAEWNAVALYDCNAEPAIEMGIERRPPAQRTLLNRNKALAAALLKIHQLADPILGTASRRILEDSLPGGKRAFELSPTCDGTPASYKTAECVGIKAAQVTYDWMMAAGWNFDGARSRSTNKMPYTDYIGYTPKNSPWDLPFPCNWQPLHETDGRGKIWIQTHLIPYAANIKPFFLDAASGLNRTISMWNCSNPTAYKAQVDEIVRYSAALNDTTKMIAEVLGPQPFTLLTNMKLRATKGWSITDVMAFNLMSVIMIDLQMGVIGREKVRHDGVRPASAVRYQYGTANITAYARGQGTRTYPGKDWVPYLSTFNEAEFPSGAVCWCTVLNEWIELWQGGDSNPNAKKFSPPLEFSFGQGCSIREPFTTPTKQTTFTISTTQEYIQYCKDARVIGGVHFRVAVDAGNAICSGVTKALWPKLTNLYPKLKGQTC